MTHLPSLRVMWGPPYAHTEATAAQAAAGRAQTRVEQLEQRLDRALLTMEGMWSILRDRLGVTDTELAARVVEIDMTDGVLDGKVRRPPAECPACKRTVSTRFPRCMYCGETLETAPFG